MSSVSVLTNLLLNIPWPEVMANAWKYGHRIFRGLSQEGMFEVLEYETILELLDSDGKKARFKKRKKVRYLQDNIIAYQDHAWGDGKILQAYRCTPGKPVDRYKLDFKTYILISLREVKSRGDVDEFNIQWSMQNSFLKTDESWTTDIGNRTKEIRVSVIFPKDRHPSRLALVENQHRKTKNLGSEYKKLLPDGRLRVTWEKKNPRLYEHYVIRWRW
jgi:hypothetical protein